MNTPHYSDTCKCRNCATVRAQSKKPVGETFDTYQELSDTMHKRAIERMEGKP